MEPQKKFSMIQSRRDAAERCMRRTIWLLRWDEERYCWFKYTCGLQYLDAYLKDDKDGKQLLERSMIFWNWWKNQWTLREETYLEDAERLEKLKVLTRRKVYLNLHNPRALASEMHPNNLVWEESYAEMIGEVNKELKQQATI